MIRLGIAASLGAAAILVMAAVLLWSVPTAAAASCGAASFYAEAHQGRTMANGQPFDMWAMTTASNIYPLGAVLRVTSGKRSVVVTVSDRGGFGKYNRILDLSKGAFAKLANPRVGVISVCVERLR